MRLHRCEGCDAWSGSSAVCGAGIRRISFGSVDQVSGRAYGKIQTSAEIFQASGAAAKPDAEVGPQSAVPDVAG